MSLKIKNKKGKTVARLEDDWSEPEVLEEPCTCKTKCKECEHKEALEELIVPMKEEEGVEE